MGVFLFWMVWATIQTILSNGVRVFSHDKAAVLVSPVKMGLDDLIASSGACRGPVSFDGESLTIGGATIPMAGNAAQGQFLADLVAWFKAHSLQIGGCISDHVRLEMLIDPDIDCVGIQLPVPVIEHYAEMDGVSQRQMIDGAMAFIATNFVHPATVEAD